jgi:hypothetical protein
MLLAVVSAETYAAMGCAAGPPPGDWNRCILTFHIEDRRIMCRFSDECIKKMAGIDISAFSVGLCGAKSMFQPKSVNGSYCWFDNRSFSFSVHNRICISFRFRRDRDRNVWPDPNCSSPGSWRGFYRANFPRCERMRIHWEPGLDRRGTGRTRSRPARSPRRKQTRPIPCGAESRRSIPPPLRSPSRGGQPEIVIGVLRKKLRDRPGLALV